MVGSMVVLVYVVVVVGFGCGSVRDTPIRTASGVLRVCVGVWGCALTCGGCGVVRVLVVHVKWCGGVVVGVVASVCFGCVRGFGGG